MSSSSSTSSDSSCSSTLSSSERLMEIWKTCPVDLIQDNEVFEIILKRGIRDGMCAHNSLASALSYSDVPAKSVEVAKVMNFTNTALRSSSSAIEVANMATDLAMTSTNLTMFEAVVNIALDAADTTLAAVRMARITSQFIKQSFNGQESDI
ncbi:uncharacterized protein LOC112599724 [Melanaphis sacchari]|uniref:uncharacterized protein LOC112599724 n=1 Tax=Melanaphis sacchari TaxID=742174 RepID=UPI000DC13EC0|nr:uncharacterized protein LOC112599724 [Melanaphis sacchari]